MDDPAMVFKSSYPILSKVQSEYFFRTGYRYRTGTSTSLSKNSYFKNKNK